MMKNTLIFFLFGFCFLTFYACSEQTDSENNLNPIVTPEFKLAGLDYEQVRMKLDEDKTVIVEYAYQDDQLLDISFELDNSIPSDRQMVMNFSGESETSEEGMRAIVLNEVIDFSDTDGVISSARGISNYPPVSCECNKEEEPPSDIFDGAECLLLNLHFKTICDLNPSCSACSVVIGLVSTEGVTEMVSSSVILLPK